MTTYTATFSGGQIRSRKSDHGYRYATAVICKSTGEIKTVTFSATSDSKPNWNFLGVVLRNYGSSAQRARWQKEIDADKQNYTIETVAVSAR